MKSRKKQRESQSERERTRETEREREGESEREESEERLEGNSKIGYEKTQNCGPHPDSGLLEKCIF